jgi:AcrR family transcriptional regulator
MFTAVAQRSRAADQSPEMARLPPGRHGLPREFVVSNQRGRLAAGTIAAVVEHGYHETTVSQIVEAAGVSRRTFYQYFGSKHECFLDTYVMVEEFLLGEMRSAGERPGSCVDRVAAELEAGLRVFATNPDLALFLFGAPQSAGGEVLEQYQTLLRKLRELLKEGLEGKRLRHPGAAIDDGLAGGIASLVVRLVRTGEGPDLGSRRDEILELVLAPYLGREAAAAAVGGLAP